VKKPPWTSTFIPGLIFTSSLCAGLFLFAVFLTPDRSQVPLTSIICLTGYVLGIPIGMAASPYREEGSHFKTIGGLVASFISGLLASKLAELDFKALFLGSSLQSGRLLLFLSFFVLGLVQTFMFRRYFDATRPRDQYAPNDKTVQGDKIP
jgi:hypothetical protein